MTSPSDTAPEPSEPTPGADAAPPASSTRRYDRSIVDGPLEAAVWKIAWPSMLVNVIGGLQGMVDHALVGHLVGYQANAAIGVAMQILIIVIVFVTSLFTGMSVLVSRAVGEGETSKVDRIVYQAFLTALLLAIGVMAPIGYLLAPTLLDWVNAAPEVAREALPFLRLMFLTSGGMLLFYMLAGALRAAGDAKTPMRLGIALTLANLALNVVFISGLGPIPAFGTVGSAIGTAIASWSVAAWAIWKLVHGNWVISFPKGGPWGLDLEIVRALFRFGLPTGVQGIVMNVGGFVMLGVIGSLAASAAAQAAFAVSYSQLFSLVTWTSVGLMGAAATVVGQNLGARQPERARAAVKVAARFGLLAAAAVGSLFLLVPRWLLATFGMRDPAVLEIGTELLRVLGVSGLFVTVALTYTGGLQGAGDTKSPLWISLASQVAVPLGICFAIRAVSHLDPLDVWLAILAGHVARAALSVFRFRQERWRTIEVGVAAVPRPD